MNVYTTCASCGLELALEPGDPWAHWTLTHDNCPPPPKSEADMLFEKFEALVAKIAAPDYRARAHDGLNLGALQERIDALDNAPPRLGSAAVIYAQWGWPVFPLRARDKRPAMPSAHPGDDPMRGVCRGECGKPGHGLYDATTDVDRIKRYWDAVPDANIGLPTGHAFDVIDVDLPDGPKSWEAMQGRPDLHGQVSTSSGGLHAYIAPTGKGNGARICPGVDYRGLGGYVVAPPSWLGDRGHQWSWLTKPSPSIRGSV